MATPDELGSWLHHKQGFGDASSVVCGTESGVQRLADKAFSRERLFSSKVCNSFMIAGYKGSPNSMVTWETNEGDCLIVHMLTQMLSFPFTAHPELRLGVL